jgi:hypothetical protein
VQIKEHCANAHAQVRHAIDKERTIGQMPQAEAVGFIRSFNPALHRPLPYFSTLSVKVVTL